MQSGWENAEAWGATGNVLQRRGWCVSLGIAPKAEGPWGMLLKGGTVEKKGWMGLGN